jgi:hypothetical protein
VAVPKPDYLSRDYAGLRQSMLQYGQQVFPEWQPASEGDFGMAMVETFAYMGDIISYYTDRAQFENYLPTATQRDSILNIAFMLGYVPNSGTPATGTVPLTTDSGTTALDRRTVPAGMQITTSRVESLDGPIVFEVNEETVLPTNPSGSAVPVSVSVTEGTTVEFQYIGESNGQPSQIFLLPNTGVYRDTIQIFVEDGGGSVKINEGAANEVTVSEWVRVERLLEGDDNDKIYEARYTSTATHIYFGDDINGAIPATGLKVYATYRHGVGATGNVGAGLVRMINTRGQQGLGSIKVATDGDGVFLSTAMTGGADPESDDSIRANAPRVYRTQERVVTEQDFIDVALGTEGVASANAVVGTFTSVTLYITPEDGGAPGEALKQAVADRLDGKTLAGVTVSIGSPQFVPVNFGTSGNPIRIEVKRGISLKNVRAAAKREIRAAVAKLDFGDVLAVNRIYKALDNIKGVVNVDIDVMVRADAASQTGTARITPKDWEMFTTDNTRIYLDVVHVAKKKKGDDDD